MSAIEIRPAPTWLQVRLAVGRLRELLAARHGIGAYYTDGEVGRVIDGLPIRPSLRAYAFAAACNLASFKAAMPGAGEADYRTLRGEIADVLGLATEDFTMHHVAQHRPDGAGAGRAG